jgi:hypothetical protein
MPILLSLDLCPRVELLDHMVDLFLVILRNLHTDFHNVCINLHSHQQYITVAFFSKFSPSFGYLFVSFVFDKNHSDLGKMDSPWDLIYISLMGNDMEHCFIYLLAIRIFHFEMCLFRSLVHFYWITRFWVFFFFESLVRSGY